MQRTAEILVCICALVFFAGCEDKNKDIETTPGQTASSDYEQPSDDYYAPSMDTGVSAGEEYSVGLPSDTSTASYSGGTADYTGGTSDYSGRATDSYAASQTTHKIGKGDTLYALARLYYNDQSKWRDIYTANSNVLRSPDRLPVGQTLVIP